MECSFCGTQNHSGSDFCEHCGAFLSQTVATKTVMQVANSPLPIQTPGSRLQNGRYEIQTILGQGGMGAVFLATDHHLAKKPVVIKELIPSSIDPMRLQDDVRNFEREATMLAHLKHPLIPSVTDHFQEGSHYFMVQEYIEGENLEAFLDLRNQPLSEGEVLAYASEVLDALEYLAQQQPAIVHRDIKPANIVISTRDRRAHLVDFGIARVNSANAKQTAPLGTPGYSPPEQYQGKADARSDVYALAATMHHALTHRDPRGHAPFQFPPVRTLNLHLSPEIEHILAHALLTSPTQRYQSARAMKQDIDDLLQRRYSVSGYRSSQTQGLFIPPNLNARNIGATMPSPQTALAGSFLPAGGIQTPTLSQQPLPVPPFQQGAPSLVQPGPTLIQPGPLLPPSRAAHVPPPQPGPKRNGWVWLVGLLILLLSLALYTAWPLLHNFSGRTVPSTPATSTLTLPASIGVVKAPDGEYIGISDGAYVFDTTGPATALKEQAAQKLRQGDTGSAFSLLSEAHSQDTSDAEALIYQENLRVVNSKYITLVLGTTLTGDSNSISVGHDNLQGAYVAQREYNDSAEQHGGVKVRLLIANSGSQTSYVSLVANQIARLAQKDKTIVAVIGWSVSAPAFAAITQFSKVQIPMISTAGGDNLTNISKYFFRVAAPANIQARVATQYAMSTLKAKNAAIFIDPANDYSRSLADDFKANFAGNGNTVVATEQYAVGDATSRPQRLVKGLQDALQRHPDVIYFAGYPADISILLQRLQPSDPPVMGGNALYELGGYTKVSSSGLSHLHFTALAYPDEWDILHLSVQKPPFFTDYPQAFGPGNPRSPYGYTRTDSGTMLAYDATLALLEASKLALKNNYPLPLTGSDIQQALAKLTGPNAFQGVTGQISFGPDGNPINKAVTIVCNRGGLFKLDTVEGQFLLNGPLLTNYPTTSICA